MPPAPSWRDFYEPPPAYEPPSSWTPDHVLFRMVEAFESLARTKGRAGPKGYGSGWPSYVYDLADLNSQVTNMVLEDGTVETDAQRDERLTKDADADARRSSPPPSEIEISRMDEALNWPLQYLRGRYDVMSRRREVLVSMWARRVAKRGDQGAEPIAAVFNEASIIAAGLRRDKVVVR